VTVSRRKINGGPGCLLRHARADVAAHRVKNAAPLAAGAIGGAARAAACTAPFDSLRPAHLPRFCTHRTRHLCCAFHLSSISTLPPRKITPLVALPHCWALRILRPALRAPRCLI